MLKRLTLLALTAFSFSLNTFASYGMMSDEERDVELKKFALSNVEKAREAYLNKYESCITESEKFNLDKKDFDKLNLTVEELKIVILYFSAKTMKECVGQDLDSYIISTNLARDFDVSGYSIKDDPNTDKSKYGADSLAIDNIKFLPDYLKISEKQRSELEKIKALKQVFNIKTAADRLIKNQN